MRDADDTCIAVCSMENVDPLGVHTGDSIVVAPVQTLPDPVHQRLRSAALAIIRALGVEGGCNVQFALSPDSRRVRRDRGQPARRRARRRWRPRRPATRSRASRPRSRSAGGWHEIPTPSPARPWPRSSRRSTTWWSSCRASRSTSSRAPIARLGSQMKATGEVMAIERTFGAALNKALRGAGAGRRRACSPRIRLDADLALDRAYDADDLRTFLAPSDSRLWRLLGAAPARRRRAASSGDGHRAVVRRGAASGWSTSSSDARGRRDV